VELGWDRYSKFDHDFVGREALEAEAADPERVLATLEWNEEDVVDVYASLFREGGTFKYMEMPHQQKRAMIADRVLVDGEDVGVATMRGYSYYFREMLSLCTIDAEHSDVGTEVTVLWGEGHDPASPTVEDHAQKEVRATVARTPYKEDRRRANLGE
jgi:vanillate/3-O-methylgallate O-demethylase